MHKVYVWLAWFALGWIISIVYDRLQQAAAKRRIEKSRINNYTHWDIHALAREMDPGAWATFDALPEVDPETGRAKSYIWFEPVKPSFNMAVLALRAGYKAPWPHIYGDEALRKFLAHREVDKAFK